MNKRIIVLIVLFLLFFLFVFLIDQNTNKEQKENYLDEKISEIAYMNGYKEVLGGNFYIDKIEWLNDDLALVFFEDGHNAFQLKYYFNPLQEIKIFFHDFSR